MKNQNLIIGVVIGVMILVGGGIFVLSSNKKAVQAPVKQTPVENEIATLYPDEIGLDLATRSDNKKVVFKIEKPQGIKTIEYELTWGAKVEDKSSGSILDVVQGTTSNGPIEINGKPYKSAEIVMGTCSDVCHYDIGVNNIKIILKITKTDGKLYQSQKTLEP